MLSAEPRWYRAAVTVQDLGRRCGRQRQRMDLARPRLAQCRHSGPQRGTGGHHIVDDQHTGSPGERTTSERRATKSLGPAATGLMTTTLAGQEATSGHVPSASEMSSDEFGLIEAAVATTRRRRGRPGDDVDTGKLVPTMCR